ncbi:hypothetical protein BDN72DRAFT_876270 [Pluteus cervinus]|uniref:Uncharacterized protein n=1 Tax=Pluteus cervinus TaxID=181527 RepID=A0ACD3B3T7_9AGAR|nr:hypothetical protein BDN72DRAFT_876270 [Pluteus cervinus]
MLTLLCTLILRARSSKHPGSDDSLPLCGLEPLYTVIQNARKEHSVSRLQQAAAITLDVLNLVPEHHSGLRQFGHACICVFYVILMTNSTGFTPVHISACQDLQRTLIEIRTFVRKHVKSPWYRIIASKTKVDLQIADFQDRLKDVLRTFGLDQDIPFHLLAQRCHELQPTNESGQGARIQVQVPTPGDPNIGTTVNAPRQPSPSALSAFAMPQSQFQGDLSCTSVQGNHSTMHIEKATIYISPQSFDVEGVSQLATLAGTRELSPSPSDSEIPVLRRQRSCPAVTIRRSPSVD